MAAPRRRKEEGTYQRNPALSWNENEAAQARHDAAKRPGDTMPRYFEVTTEGQTRVIDLQAHRHVRQPRTSWMRRYPVFASVVPLLSVLTVGAFFFQGAYIGKPTIPPAQFDWDSLAPKPNQSAKEDFSDLAAKPPGLTYTPVEEPGAIIRYTPGQPIIVTVSLNGRSSARLILDTGAGGSMVKPDLLAAAGVELSRPSARGTGTSVTDKTRLSFFSVDFEVDGLRVRMPEVAAFNLKGNEDGLLGMDFLNHFTMTMDPAAGTVTLVPR